MRTLPPVQRGSAGIRKRRRLAACGVLLGVVVTLAAAAAVPTSPMAVDRSVYRATIRARGGTFVSSPGVVLQSGFTDCGPAALATLVHTLGGNPPSTDSLARLAGTGARGTTFAGLARTARLLGIANELRRLSPAAMDALHTPVIAWVDGGHFVTVVPDSSRSVLVLDPAVGPYRIEWGRLRRYWSGEALVPARTEAGPVEIPRRRRTRMKTVTKWRSAGVVLMLAMLAAVPLTGGAPALEVLRGGSIMAAVGCLLCAGAGIASVLSGGSIAWVIWTVEGTAVAVACAASCVAAVM